jgi:plastocyanin
MAAHGKRLVLAALAVVPLALAACAADPAESTIQVSSSASPASESASPSASDTAASSTTTTSTSTTTTTTMVASTPPASGSPGVVPAGCSTVIDSGTTVTLAGIKYAPATVSVPRCSRITVENQDKTQHSVTFVSGPATVTGVDLLNPGDSNTFVVATAGTYNFKCRFHATMKLTVTAQ